MRDYVKRVSEMLPKLSQEQLKTVLNSITTENEMLDSILESLSTGLIVVDRKWKILKINKIAERYLSFMYYSDEAKGENLRVWEFISEPEISEFLKKCADEDKTNVSEEFTTTDSIGSVRFLTVSIFSLVHNSEMRGNIIKIYDITEKRKQEVKLRRMENMAGLTNLAAGMAHEIKNPLGAISIHIQLIQRAVNKKRSTDGMLPDKKLLEEHLDVVNEEIENLNKLVMDFLFAVRPVKAELTLSNPVKVLSNIVEFFAPEFNKSCVSLVLNTPSNCPRLLIDEKLFREAVINLIQNAFAAIKERYGDSCCAQENQPEKKDMTGKIIITVSESYDKILIAVEDNGTGMSGETAARIFEPYFTTKANGTGLGMTMVYKIIKEFSGDIQVKSEQGKGTSFVLSIPVPQTDRKLIES